MNIIQVSVYYELRRRPRFVIRVTIKLPTGVVSKRAREPMLREELRYDVLKEK